MQQEELREFIQSSENSEMAHVLASACSDFKEDCDDECIGDELISCYNCRYRRWIRNGYACMKGRVV